LTGNRGTHLIDSNSDKLSPNAARQRLAILGDFHEEGWPSMDLAAEMLFKELVNLKQSGWKAELIVPAYRERFGWTKAFIGEKMARNIDRLYNRMREYPRQLKQHKSFSFFHVCDHSYAHLLNCLPRGKAGVFCHDLDTFRCILEPEIAPRPAWFRKMTRSILTGFQQAAVVFHPTMETGREIIKHQLIAPEKLVLAPNGVSTEFTSIGRQDDKTLLQSSTPLLLNVGSCIHRKRIDVLLKLFAEVRKSWPGVKLLQIGGSWTADQLHQIDRLGIAPHVKQIRGITRVELADYYRQAAIMLQTTEAEGFGLPIVEALACGAIVLTSDVPVLREVGGDAVTYAQVANIEQWCQAIQRVRAGHCPTRNVRQMQAARFSWQRQAETVLVTYQQLSERKD